MGGFEANNKLFSQVATLKLKRDWWKDGSCLEETVFVVCLQKKKEWIFSLISFFEGKEKKRKNL